MQPVGSDLDIDNFGSQSQKNCLPAGIALTHLRTYQLRLPSRVGVIATESYKMQVICQDGDDQPER